MASWVCDQRGQSTVEYVLVLVAFAVVIAGLCALAKALQGGSLVDHALVTASHHLQGDPVAAALDLFSV